MGCVTEVFEIVFKLKQFAGPIFFCVTDESKQNIHLVDEFKWSWPPHSFCDFWCIYRRVLYSYDHMTRGDRSIVIYSSLTPYSSAPCNWWSYKDTHLLRYYFWMWCYISVGLFCFIKLISTSLIFSLKIAYCFID